jgi:hypothetical protein
MEKPPGRNPRRTLLPTDMKDDPVNMAPPPDHVN